MFYPKFLNIGTNQVSFKGLKLWEKIKTELKHNFKKSCKRSYIENY